MNEVISEGGVVLQPASRERASRGKIIKDKSIREKVGGEELSVRTGRQGNIRIFITNFLGIFSNIFSQKHAQAIPSLAVYFGIYGKPQGMEIVTIKSPHFKDCCSAIISTSLNHNKRAD